MLFRSSDNLEYINPRMGCEILKCSWSSLAYTVLLSTPANVSTNLMEHTNSPPKMTGVGEMNSRSMGQV